ncbi:uncharacterized protein [Argopecten irradians]|uniref:uncharacterized protein n=1 Tax=Argopecten irradians TaxID=31199 RepID=UPI00371040BE
MKLLVILVLWMTEVYCVSDFTQMATELFTTTDLNGDLEVSRTEIESSFTKYDENGDGRVSRVEFMDFVDRYTPDLHDLGRELYIDYDSNQDHHIDLADFEAYFNKLDTSGDGRVTKDEFVNYWSKLMAATAHLHPVG